MLLAAILAQLALLPASQAPSPPADTAPAPSIQSEWIVGVGFAHSVQLFQSDANRKYVVQNVSWGRELTRSRGAGLLRGRFTWAAEVMPVFFQTAPTHVYGVGVVPVVWRWNFSPQRRWSAFAELAMGGLWTTDPVPEETRSVNFTAHWGGGVRVPGSARHAFVLGYRFQHISNGNQLRTNPGVNSHVLMAGWSVK